MAKLLKRHYIEIINRTIAGETRSEIAKHVPVCRQRISRILCDIVDNSENDYLKTLLSDYLTDDMRQQLADKMMPGRSKKLSFISYAELAARDEQEYTSIVKAWQNGYQDGYNTGRAKRKF